MTPIDIERATMSAWPAGETHQHACGWYFLAASGVTGRVNAVWPLEWRGGDVNAAIEDAEAWYRARGMPPRFKLTEGAVAPTELAELLAQRGYQATAHTLVMIRELAGAGNTTDGVFLSTGIPDSFDHALQRSTADAEELEERRAIARRAPAPRAFATRGDPAAAIGMSAMAGELAGIFLMRTMPDARRSGHARHILRALLTWASHEGARSAFLQVDADNTPAVKLYESEGFTTLTSYCFWRKAS